MTQSEISTYLNIPFATLNDWKKENSNRHKLYELLANLDKDIVSQIFNKPKEHRIFHVLNRNVISEEKFTFHDIKNAFTKNNYHEGTIKEQTIYSKFFKEIDIDELDDFIKTFNVSKRDIKNIYISSPFRTLGGVSKKWDNRFRLKSLTNHNISFDSKPTSLLQSIINQRGINV